MRSIIASSLLLLVAGAFADPQFNFGGLSKAQPPSAIGSSLFGGAAPSFPDAAQLLEWPAKIQDLVELTTTVLTSMGEIAVSDNPDVGARIVKTLQGEIARAAKIFADFTANVASTGRLRKRAVSNGDKAYNEVGEVLVGSNDKIAGDKKQLSSKAQKRIDKKHREGVKKCKADSCKAAAAAITAAEDAEDERE